eukprot:CAMPEP_0172564896 /NCGR_PEP_ID=MMETSP1067-20121228/106091_1 /TAXON_ID=265564 ORGANISM="Thalassiosira punctigera, Strain Tpunct2005C2" /NCGR_SAMPLE_ID=MMETSP1067 /ASSEMBLY_ACC=CAM_ASM_000444 /LENGTH=156 /DNA_ID=CAMNT_0013355681 /DNA_START=140 /DNA_END=606 /DNA_ORIENTATION=+
MMHGASRYNLTTKRMISFETSMHSNSSSTSTQDRRSMHATFITASFPRLSQFGVPVVVRHSSNGAISNKVSDEINKRRGDECYRLATEALRNASRAKRKREELLLQEQYDAMDRQRKITQQRERQRGRERRRQDPRLEKLNDAEVANGGGQGARDR